MKFSQCLPWTNHCGISHGMARLIGDQHPSTGNAVLSVVPALSQGKPEIKRHTDLAYLMSVNAGTGAITTFSTDFGLSPGSLAYLWRFSARKSTHRRLTSGRTKGSKLIEVCSVTSTGRPVGCMTCDWCHCAVGNVGMIRKGINETTS